MLAYEEVINDELKQDNEQGEITFYGFALPDEENYFSILHDWKMIGAHINNLAEYKIVDYILQITWGTGNPYNRVPLTIESLMHGYVDDEGERIDDGTGLSRQSVITGIEKAIKHGLIEREIEYWKDEDGRTRTTRYYGLKFYAPAEVNNLDFDNFPMESAVEIVDSEPDQTSQVNDLDFDDNQPVEPFVPESLNRVPLSNNSNNIHIDSNSNIIRITERQEFVDRQRGKEKYPAFIRSDIKELSCDLGDGEHIASNIAQTSKIYEQSGMSQDQFAKLLYKVKEIARGKVIKKLNSQGRPNRMPYFFSCLKKSLVNQEAATNEQTSVNSTQASLSAGR